MARVISDACISCGSCAAQCPVEAIAQGDTQYEIDADACIDCGGYRSGRYSVRDRRRRLHRLRRLRGSVPCWSYFRGLSLS